MQDKNKALATIIEAVLLAQKRGAFELKEAKIIAEAVEQFTTPAPVAEQNTPVTGAVASPAEYQPEPKKEGGETPTNG